MLHIALLGFGTVGSGVDRVISENKALIREQTGLDVNVKYILDLRDFDDPRVVHDYDIILSDPEIVAVAEMMGGVHPAYEFSAKAIEAGKNVVTSNKAVVAAYGPELLALAAEHHVRYLFEASVGGAIPCIRAITHSMVGNEITEIAGILNGTTNYILTAMSEGGTSYEDALAEAKRLGFAEADPTADVEGHDACRKICILGAMATGVLVPFEKVFCQGITRLTDWDMKDAATLGAKVKLVARFLANPDGSLHLSVQPFAVLPSSPLYHIDGVENAVAITGAASSRLTLQGPGAGSLPTASAVVSDILDILSFVGNQPAQRLWVRSAEAYEPEMTDEQKEETNRLLGFPISQLQQKRYFSK